MDPGGLSKTSYLLRDLVVLLGGSNTEELAPQKRVLSDVCGNP